MNEINKEMGICTRPIRNDHLIDSGAYAFLLGGQNDKMSPMVTVNNSRNGTLSER